MPIQSMHSPHFPGYTFGHGSYTKDLAEVPNSVFGWKQGQSMAWLIDWLDYQRKPVYRSAAPAPYGILPTWPDAKAVDLEILSVGSWSKAAQYPENCSERIGHGGLLGHWENFFGNKPQEPELMKGHHVEKMMEKAKALVGEQAPPGAVYRPKSFAEIVLLPPK